MIKVYVACPYTLGDVAENVKNAIAVTEELYNMGVNPFNPLLSHFHQMAFPRSYNDWMRVDYDWIDVCDAVLRIPGISEGADMETRYARNHGKPVFNSIVDLEYYVSKSK